MNTDREARHIHDEYQPTVCMRLVSLVFPFQNQPEDNSSESRRVGVYLTLYSREPEGVAEGVDECTHHGRGLNGYPLVHGDVLQCYGIAEVLLLDEQTAHQVTDGPEKEQDGCC